jgi:hypothetical protein
MEKISLKLPDPVTRHITKMRYLPMSGVDREIGGKSSICNFWHEKMMIKLENFMETREIGNKT